ncbi:hypothetical protein RV00_GL000645 [Enterococcus devriesei]|uniref:Uncharacterized protein n=1 Tax=Enterococcus devriesei TaxID=319970 RepID=A0A1L8SSH5_9ENTE|nr:hypothetical protein RV00_GL000645 [Enterococcus devriesei]
MKKDGSRTFRSLQGLKTEKKSNREQKESPRRMLYGLKIGLIFLKEK